MRLRAMVCRWVSGYLEKGEWCSSVAETKGCETRGQRTDRAGRQKMGTGARYLGGGRYRTYCNGGRRGVFIVSAVVMVPSLDGRFWEEAWVLKEVWRLEIAGSGPSQALWCECEVDKVQQRETKEGK